MNSLKYDLSEAKKTYDERPHFVEIRAWDEHGNGVVIVTNKALEGEWIKISTPFGTEYRQTLGTLQIDYSSESKMRRSLREKYDSVTACGAPYDFTDK